MKKHPPITQSVNRKYWEGFTDDELDDYATHLFREVREYGFPYHTRQDKHKKEIKRLLKKRYPEDFLLLNDNGLSLKQHMGGLGFLWTFFPHAWSIKCGNGKTPVENFLDDDALMAVIKKRLTSNWAGNFSLSMLYKSLRMFNGAQAVSNFRPTSAGAIYSWVSKEHFNANKINVLDTSAGWGGRLLGAFLSPQVVNYYGIEPSTKTVDGLWKVMAYLEGEGYEKTKAFNVYGGCSENEESYSELNFSPDFVFTSPPYFDTEKYSEDESQSYVKYPTYSNWMDNFLGVTVDNISNVIHEKSLVAWNVGNTINAPSLVKDLHELMLSKSFKLITTMKYLMSGRPQKSDFKFEPVMFYVSS